MIEQEYIPLAILGVVVAAAALFAILRPSKEVVKKPSIKKVAAITKDGKYVEGVSTDAFKIEDLQKLTKAKIDEFGEAKGIKLDRRKTKKAMIEDLLSAIEGNNHKLGK
tara:strand:+ start:1391 stop:1717 length:327 start_codon:yes stop_codon:yes gene_type:complete